MHTEANDSTLFPARAVELIDPSLNVVYIMSPDIEQRMNRLKGHGLSYTEYPLKKIVMNEGLDEYNLTLLNGRKIRNCSQKFMISFR